MRQSNVTFNQTAHVEFELQIAAFIIESWLWKHLPTNQQTTMSHVDSGPKNDSDSEQKTEPARDSSSGEMVVPKTKLLDAKAILWTFGKCLTAMLPVYLAGYYRMSTSLVMFGMMVYAGWKHSREAKEARLRSAIQLLNDEQEYISSKSFRSRGDLPSWVRMHKSPSFDRWIKLFTPVLLLMHNAQINHYLIILREKLRVFM